MAALRAVALVPAHAIGSDEALAQASARPDARNGRIVLLGGLLQHHTFLLFVQRQQTVAHRDEVVDHADPLQLKDLADDFSINIPR